ncbi:hypothetical protein BGW80DRAFT_1321540 [Lactifluus volemus]|nr:hypothetical protein BGW80DRAFT_1321540 [Lactifluus volemus]
MIHQMSQDSRMQNTNQRFRHHQRWHPHHIPTPIRWPALVFPRCHPPYPQVEFLHPEFQAKTSVLGSPMTRRAQ